MLSLVAALLLSGCDLDVATTAQLAKLTSPAQRSPYRFELSARDGALQVRLLSDTGLVRSREVAASGVCEDDARVAAVILSAWMAQAEPARAPPVVTKPAQRPAAARPAPASVVAPAPVATPVDPAPVAPAAPLEELVDDPDRPLLGEQAPLARWSWSAALEAGAVVGGGGAPALTLRAEGGRRLGVVTDLTVLMEREQLLGPGTVLWARAFGSVGLRARWLPANRWLVDASLSLAAGWLFTREVGLTASGSGQGRVDGGACAGVVVGGYELGPFGMFLSARVCGWPWAPRLAFEGLEEKLQLPVLDGVMGVGVMWGERGG